MANDSDGIGPTPAEEQLSQPSDFNSSVCEDLRQTEAGHADKVHLKELRDFHSSGCEAPSREDCRQPDNSDNTKHNNSSGDQSPAIQCNSDIITPKENKDIPRRRVSIAEVPPFVHYYEEKAAESDEQQSETKRLSLASALSRTGSRVSLFTSTKVCW